MYDNVRCITCGCKWNDKLISPLNSVKNLFNTKYEKKTTEYNNDEYVLQYS